MVSPGQGGMEWIIARLAAPWTAFNGNVRHRSGTIDCSLPARTKTSHSEGIAVILGLSGFRLGDPGLVRLREDQGYDEARSSLRSTRGFPVACECVHEPGTPCANVDGHPDLRNR